jgi:acyl-coenzyme A synthetase/AMP-(fatty) acid ligase/thioesterase domain-containing protein/acyl carrier protein
MDRAVGAIAARLIADVPEHSAVALLAHGSVAVAQVALAVYRAGMVLVAIDPTAPADRVRALLLDSDAAVLLVEAGIEPGLDGGIPCPVLEIAEVVTAGLAGPRVDVDFGENGLRSLSYTSGSTGTPKAVMWGAEVSPEMTAVIESLLPTGDGAWAALSAGSLGASIGLLTTGLAYGRTVLPIEVRSVGLQTLADLIDSNEVACLVVVPTVLRFWLPTLEPGRRFPSILMIGAFGEAMTGEDHNALGAILSPEAKVMNLYASTEAGFVTVLMRPAGEVAPPGPLPVGAPVADIELTIVDEDGVALPDGQVGEIVVTSNSTSLGYWRRPELTKAIFGMLPDGRRTVRTGDQGRLLPDGTLLVLGRSDHVVKVSGNRVDFGDVEHALRAVTGVQDAAVAARVDESGITTLHGYIVPAAGQHDLHHGVVRSQLARRIPSWMLPVTLTTLPVLPRLANGKVNRRELPEPQPAPAGASERQANDLEQEFLALWREALGRPDIGLDDNFFVLGGDSMTAAAIMAEIDHRHGVSLPVSLLVEAPTVAELARALNSQSHESVLVPIRTTGDLDPLIVVHGGLGEAFFAAGIAEHVDPARPVYALRLPLEAHADAGGEGALESLASIYVDAVLQVQPNGPYLLFGFSAGGVIAYEMALQLERAGQRVEMLILGDSPAPGISVDAGLLSGLDRRSARLRQLRTSGVKGGALLAARLVANQARHRLARVRNRGAAKGTSAQLDSAREAAEQRARQRAAVIGAMLSTYRPLGNLTAPARLVRANLPGPPDLGWSHVIARLDVASMACDHYVMVREPHVRDLGAHIESAVRVQSRLG